MPDAATVPTILPQTLSPNLLWTFGLLLVFGMLGGLLAARVRWLPTITGFMAAGLAIGPSGFGLISAESLAAARIFVDIALGLILFRLGVALHPIQAVRTPGLLLTSVGESLATFVGVTALMAWVAQSWLLAVVAGAIAVSSSAAVLVHVAHELDASGPAVDAAEGFVAANNLWSFLLYTMMLPVVLHSGAFSLAGSIGLPLWRLFGGVAIALLMAFATTRVALWTRGDELHLRFALVVAAVMVVLGLASMLQVSGLLAALSFGIACRWMERDEARISTVSFGGGGDLFFIILFVVAGANLHLKEAVQYAGIALAFVAVRSLAKVLVITLGRRAVGTPPRTALATGLLTVPMAGMAIGLVQATESLVPELGGRVAAIVLAAVAVFETLGPPLAAFAIRMAGEAGQAAKRPPNGVAGTVDGAHERGTATPDPTRAAPNNAKGP